MKVIAFIEDYKVVRKILDYLGIDEFKKRDRPPPKTLAVADSLPENIYAYFLFKIPCLF